jgi:hypothetical protein
MGYLLFGGVIAIAALVAGCASQGVGDSSLPGTWSLSQGSATATYVFNADGSAKFDGGSPGGGMAHIEGTWYIDNDKLGLAFDGLPTIEVSFSIAGDKLTIVDDPATVRVGGHATVVYTRVK